MILDDFVMLGKTVPEANSDGRHFVCTAGYSLELRQPIRIYPMARRQCPARWSVSRIPVERNPKDARRESWKIRGDRSPGAHDFINGVIEPVSGKLSPAMQREIVADIKVSSLKAANDRRLSLCVVLPDDIPRIDLEAGEAAEMAPTPDMFGEVPGLPVAARFRWHPRLRFGDGAGKHDLMLRDWGCYELMRKHGDEMALSLGEALNLTTAPPLLCGNLNRFRNSWLVISVFSGTVHARPEVFDAQVLTVRGRGMTDGIPDMDLGFLDIECAGCGAMHCPLYWDRTGRPEGWRCDPCMDALEAAGDAISRMMEDQGLGFVEAVERLVRGKSQ